MIFFALHFFFKALNRKICHPPNVLSQIKIKILKTHPLHFWKFCLANTMYRMYFVAYRLLKCLLLIFNANLAMYIVCKKIMLVVWFLLDKTKTLKTVDKYIEAKSVEKEIAQEKVQENMCLTWTFPLDAPYFRLLWFFFFCFFLLLLFLLNSRWMLHTPLHVHVQQYSTM